MKKLLFLFVLAPFISLGQVQIGQDINGEVAGDQSGYAVSLNDNGSVVAIGAFRNDENGMDSGHVRVYEDINGTWTQIGNDIDGDFANDFFGVSLDLNSSGNILAISASNSSPNGISSGLAKVYENQAGTWTQIGQTIVGEAAQDRFGREVSLSADGNILAVSSLYHNNGRGHARIFENIGGVWTQVGSDIEGEFEGDLSGWSLSLSSDGSIVAIGSRNNDGSGNSQGHVRIFENVGGVWTQIGSDIDGEADGDLSGSTMSLSADGSIVAIGSIFNSENGTSRGHVRIFENIGGIWTQIGSDIDGETDGDFFGYSVSLSSSGNIVAIGATNTDGNGNNSGYVKIFQNQSGVWTQTGNTINGEAADDRSGYRISLSANSDRVAIGSIFNDGNGMDSGHVRVYDLTSVNSSITLIPDSAFEQALINQSIDSDGIINGQVLTSDVSSLTSLNLFNSGISDLTGIEDFISLTNLNVNNNQLTSINVSTLTNLTILIVSVNQLTSVDVSNNINLLTLSLDFNELISIDVSNNVNLTTLASSSNLLTDLDVSNNINLINLYAFNNQLTSIDISNNSALDDISLSSNQLTSIDLSNNTLLTGIDIDSNQLTNLDLSNNTNLFFLAAVDNQIQSLDLSLNNQIEFIYINDNDLTSLNIQNGTNTIIGAGDLVVNGNPNLFCIQVDNITYSENIWTDIDAQTSFSEDCDSFLALLEVIEDIAGNANGVNVTAEQLNAIEGVSGAIDGVNYTTALQNGTFVDPNNPTEEEIQLIIDQVNATLSVEQESIFHFKIFPNPTKDQFTIELENPLELQKINIYNKLGQTVLTTKETVIDTSKLASGLYTVEIEVTKGKGTQKLIIE